MAMKRISKAAVSAFGLACSLAATAASAQQVTVLSSRADTVSDGDALVSIALQNGATAADVKVSVGAADGATAFRQNGNAAVGLVKGLKPGRNTITASVKGSSANLVLVNHSRNGPIFSGPHQTPFIFETADFKLPDGTKLGAPQDANCNVPTKVICLYKPTAGKQFKPMPADGSLPADLITTTTHDGRTVNYIVRFETGTINRASYQTAVLFDPTKGEQVGPTADHPAWNGRAVFVFGGGATAGYHQGAVVAEDILSDDILSRGFAALSSTLSVMAIVGSDVRSAETGSIVEERFIETYGPMRYAFGWGGSGGSMQQHLIGNNYPGILDGIIPGSSFPQFLFAGGLRGRLFADGQRFRCQQDKVDR